MATIAEPVIARQARPDVLSGTPRAHAIDRWIFVFMAAWFIAIVLTGFIPDSLAKIAAVQAVERPPFPLAMHVHAVLMGSFLLLLFAQTWLMATGRSALHMQLGLLGVALAAALVVAGFILAPTNYHSVWQAANFGPPAMREAMASRVPRLENILLLQLRIGVLFPLFLAIAVQARGADAGLHKRMMILCTAIPLEAAFARMDWLPTTMPESPFSQGALILLAIAPMVVWDLIRNRRVHQAYWIWLAVCLPSVVLVEAVWDRPWWHATARQLMGV